MSGFEERETLVKQEKPDSITLSKSLSGKYTYSIKVYSDLTKEGHEEVIKRLEDVVADLNKKYAK